MTENNTLSARETEILKLVAKGLTNREIAQQLTISPNTVKVHLSNIFEKIGAASRTEATMYGIEHGIVDVPGGAEAPAAEPVGWRTSLRRYAWFGIPAVLLILALLVVLTISALRPPETPEAQLAAEMAQRWQALAPMPAARAAMAAAAYDGEIYAIAGEGPEGVSGSVFRYTPETDSWSQLRDKPTPVADVHGVLIGEKIYVPGGRRGGWEPDRHPRDL
jgi:DNA-binding CsgD family transcriptional regulator